MDATTIELYISLLEKTNQQLSLYSNPYGVLVGTLSFLVAFLAVGTVFVIHRQSKEYREMYKNAVDNYEKALQEEIKNIGLQASLKIDSLIEIETSKFKDLTGETKKRAEKIIEDLKDRKETIGSEIQFSTLNKFPHTDSSLILKEHDPFIISNVFKDPFTCSNCKTYVGYLSGQKYCGNCGYKL